MQLSMTVAICSKWNRVSRSLFAANGLDDRANHRADHSRTTINRMTVTPLIDERRSEAGAIDVEVYTHYCCLHQVTLRGKEGSGLLS